jgi:putative tricarboxylic transport membrane protein
MLLNPIQGRTQLTHNDVTPIAYVITEPMIAVVRADSPLKTGKDLLDALSKNPAGTSIALTSTGHRISVGIPLHKAGVSIKNVRMPAFKGGGETVTAVMGGHADVLITSVSTSVPHIESGKMRGIAVSSTKRLGGALADVPTWQELGYQSSGSWKGVMAPKGITPAQIAFWEDVMRKTAASDEIRRYAEQNQWLVEFKGANETRKWLDQEAAALKTIMAELGLTKAP